MVSGKCSAKLQGTELVILSLQVILLVPHLPILSKPISPSALSQSSPSKTSSIIIISPRSSALHDIPFQLDKPSIALYSHPTPTGTQVNARWRSTASSSCIPFSVLLPSFCFFRSGTGHVLGDMPFFSGEDTDCLGMKGFMLCSGGEGERMPL